MTLEHFALNIADPVSWSAWYCKNLSLRIVKHFPERAETHFLADSNGVVCVEVYRNPSDNIPNYAEAHPLQMHLAFKSDDPTADRDRLEAEGASIHETLEFEDGTCLVMMRDPWGVAFQLCKRATALI